MTDDLVYSDAYLRQILSTTRVIAMVGASANWNRPSYFVMKYLQGKGYRVIPVNPGLAGQELLGETVYASLRDIPEKVDLVQPFANLPSLPDDLSDAFDAFKLAILHHKSAGWQSVEVNAVLVTLEALKSLAVAPSDETAAS